MADRSTTKHLLCTSLKKCTLKKWCCKIQRMAFVQEKLFKASQDQLSDYNLLL